MWREGGRSVTSFGAVGAHCTHAAHLVSMAMQSSVMIGRTLQLSGSSCLIRHRSRPIPLHMSTISEGSKCNTTPQTDCSRNSTGGWSEGVMGGGYEEWKVLNTLYNAVGFHSVVFSTYLQTLHTHLQCNCSIMYTHIHTHTPTHSHSTLSTE